MQDLELQPVSQPMNLIATELQEEVTKTRQPPIGISGTSFRTRCGTWLTVAARQPGSRWRARHRTRPHTCRIAAQSSRWFGSPKFCPPEHNQLFVRLLR